MVLVVLDTAVVIVPEAQHLKPPDESIICVAQDLWQRALQCGQFEPEAMGPLQQGHKRFSAMLFI